MKDMWKYSELIPRVVYVTGMTKPEAAVHGVFQKRCS